MKLIKNILNWFLGKEKESLGNCFNCGKELNDNYSSISYEHAEGESEYARLCEDCANILDHLESVRPIEVPEDFENDP